MELDYINKDEWEELVALSPQGTIFHSDLVLSTFGIEYDFGLIKRKGNPLGAIALPRGKEFKVFPYQAYNGFIFHPDLLSKKQVARIEGQFQMAEFLGNELLERYDHVAINCIDYDETLDLRGYHWINYHDKTLPSYASNTFYTSTLATSNPFDQKILRKGRNSSLNKSKKFNLRSELTDNIDNMKKIYLSTFERQEIKLADETLEIANRQFTQLGKSKNAIMSATYCDDQLASMAIFGIDKKRAYYMFGANDTEFRSYETGTANIIWSMETLNKMGINEVDMVGVNSPQRGSFKLSFGGNLKPYYQINKMDVR